MLRKINPYCVTLLLSRIFVNSGSRFYGRFEKNIKRNRSERNLSSSTRSIDIRQKLQDMFYEKIVSKKMSSSKTEFVMSKETNKFVDISNIQLMSSLPSSLTFKGLEKMINASIKSTATD